MKPGRHLLLRGLRSVTAASQAQSRDRDQDRGRDRERGLRVIVYEDEEYRGDRLVLYPGDSLEKLSGLTFL